MQVVYNFIKLLPAIPMSVERPCTHPSNSEIRRWINDGAVRINFERWKADEEMPPLVYSLVFFPNGARRTTMI